MIDAGDKKTTTVEIAGFNASLGTLTGVRLTTSVASSFLRVTETGDFNGQDLSVDTSGSGSAILTARTGGISNSISLGSDVQDPGSRNSFIPAASDTAFRSNTFDVLLDPFREDKVQIEFESIFAVDGIVRCTFDFTVEFNRVCSGGLRQRYAASSTSTSSGNELQVTYSVVYEYTPFDPEPPSAVPLPAGLPMLLTALGFFGLRRFRR